VKNKTETEKYFTTEITLTVHSTKEKKIFKSFSSSETQQEVNIIFSKTIPTLKIVPKRRANISVLIFRTSHGHVWQLTKNII